MSPTEYKNKTGTSHLFWKNRPKFGERSMFEFGNLIS
jgi:hypothetical protein